MIKEEREKLNEIELSFGCKKYTRYERENWPSKIHYHDYIELVYGLAGECTCILGNRKITVREGDLLLITDGEPHEVGIHDEWTSYIIIKFLPDTLFSRGQSALENSSAFSLLKNVSKLQRFFPKSETVGLNFDFLCNDTLKECTERKIGYDMCVRAHILEIFMRLMRIWDANAPGISKPAASCATNRILQSAITFIEQNYSDVDRDKCAHATGVSPSYLSKLFTRELNVQFSDFVNDVKLREAEKLLLTTDKSITEISFLSGFSSTAYFISIFKQKHSLTPAKYRKSIMI